MSNIQNYEISLWRKERASAIIGDEIRHYFYDKKIATIGADDINTFDRISNPILTEQTDGSVELAFTILKSHYDNSGILVTNKFYSLLVNEALIKLYYKEQWYDFIIKSIDENVADNTVTYTCKSLYIEELSKIGDNIVLDNELENNFGTVTELGATILTGTDWTVDTINSDIISQKLNSPVYEGTALSNIAVTALTNDYSSNITTIPTGDKFYYFYIHYTNKDSSLQLIYDPTQTYLVEDSLFCECDNFIANDISYSTAAYTTTILQNEVVIIENNLTPINMYQAERIIIAQLSQYEGNKKQYVLKYIDNQGNAVYGYTTTDYITDTTVQNFITNYKDFTSLAGYITESGLSFETFIYPPYDATTSAALLAWMNTTKKFYLKTLFTPSNNILCNTGIADNRTIIGSFIAGDSYTLRLKYDYGSVPGTTGSDVKVKICKYRIVNSEFILDEDNVYFIFDNFVSANGYLTQTVASLKTCLPADLATTGIFLYVDTPDGINYHFFEDIQFFKTVYDKNNLQIYPDTIVTSEAKTKYIYYSLINGQTGEDAINYLYQGYTPSVDYTPVYDTNYNKIMSIEGKESNCFNLLQTLAETFECWIKFVIAHDATGAISLDENYAPIKKVQFKKYYGVQNFTGFHYGINLSSITRNLISDDIVTKLIIPNNDNDCLENGTCSISTASENISKENFIYNFNYYINKGLLDAESVIKDLYGTSPEDLSYLTKLGEYNRLYDSNSKAIVAIDANLLKLNASKTTYSEAIASAELEILNYKNELYIYSHYTYDQILAGSYSALLTDQNAQDYLTSIQNLELQRDTYIALLANIEAQIVTETANQNVYTASNDNILIQKQALHLAFYKIYSAFIKEGKWKEDSYLDSNLYYLDGCAVLNNSAFPAVEYTINVIDVSKQTGLELFTFAIGDRTFIQDEDFFGYISINGILTPFRQEVIISKLETNLDDPSQNKITIKTYKHSFKDLFQQITATSQSLTFAQGSYARAANAITSTGQITPTVLQETILNNSITLMNSKNESVVWDDSGITITDLLNHNKQIRLVSGGLFLTADAGTNWSSGITANGINASLLTAGRIDVNKIYIVNEDIPTFRWTADGINAYRWEESGAYDLTTFIRLDQFGLYGINGGSENFKPTGVTIEDKILSIQNTADFALLWDGFFLKSVGTAGYLKISSDADIQIFQDVSQNYSGNYVDRLTLGRIGGDIYGLRLKHADDTIALITDSHGDLTLNGIMTITPEILTGVPTIQLGVIYTDSMKTEIKEYFSVRDGAIDKFIIDGAGNVYVSGEIVATSGTIGGFTINNTSLSSINGRVVLSPTTIQFFDKIDTDDTRMELFSFTTENGDGSLFIRGRMYISGESIITNKLYIGDSNGIVLDASSKSIFHPYYTNDAQEGGFLIDGDGKIYAKSIELGDYASIKNYLQMGDSYIYNPAYGGLDKFLSVQIDGIEYASLNNQGILAVQRLIVEGSPEIVTVNGVTYTTNTINGNLHVTGSLNIGENSITINGSAGTIYSDLYTDNQNRGWMISEDGSAIFNNVTLRGKLQSAVFEYNTLASIGGTLFVSPSIQTTDIIIGSSDETLVTFAIPVSYEQYLLWENIDYATVDLEHYITYNKAIDTTFETVDDITTYYILVMIPISELGDYFDDPNYWLPAGTILVSTSTNVNNIQLDATDVNGPRISMTFNDETDQISVYIGNLNGIQSDNFDLQGYGLYGQNVFLEGKLYLPNAGITDEGDLDTSIRIWAGATAQNKESAPFYVTKGGFLHAVYGEFSGVVRNSTLVTSNVVGDNGLGLYGNSPINFYSGIVTVSNDGTITGDTILKLKIDSDGLTGFNTNILFQSYLNETYLDIFKVDYTTGVTTINSLILNGLKLITLSEDTDHLAIKYGQNSITLSETSFSTAKIATVELTTSDKLFIGDTQIYYLDVKNKSDKNIGYDVYILS